MKEITSLKHCKECTRHFTQPKIVKGKAICVHCGSLKWKPMVGEKIL